MATVLVKYYTVVIIVICKLIVVEMVKECEMQVSCEDYGQVKGSLEESGHNVHADEIKWICSEKNKHLFPRYPNVYQLVQHNLLSGIADLMKVWKRSKAVFIIDQSSGISPGRDGNILNKYHIRAVFVWYSLSTIDHLKDIYNTSENIVILCSENNVQIILNEVNRLDMFNSVHTWIVAGHRRPKIFNSITLHVQTSFTFFQINSTDDVNNESKCDRNHLQDKDTIVSLRLSSEHQTAEYNKKAVEISIFDVFYGHSRQRTEMVQFATWNAIKGLFIFEVLGPKDRSQRLRGKLVRAVVFEHFPYSKFTYKDNNRTLVVNGYMKDIYDMIASTLNARYVVKGIPPGFGMNINGTFTGVVGVLHRKEAETSLNVIAYVLSRLEAVQYGGPVTRGFLAICYNRPKPFVPPTTYWIPFKWNVWLTILIFFIVLVAAIGLGMYTSPGSAAVATPSMTVHTKFYRAITGTFFTEALNDPPGLPCKVFYGALLLAVLMIFSHYTSVITSYLTLLEIKIPFASLHDVVNDNDYRILYMKNTRHEDMFQNADDGVFADLWKKITGGFSDPVPDFVTGLARMYTGRYVYLTEGPTTLSLTVNNCSVSFASKTYMDEFFYFASRNDFPYTRIIYIMLLKILESGIMNRLASVYNMHKRPPCVLERSSESLGLEQAVGLYVIFGIGICLAFLVLIVERICASKYVRRTNNIIRHPTPNLIENLIPQKQLAIWSSYYNNRQTE